LPQEAEKVFWQQIQSQEDSAVGEFGNAQVYARLGDEEKALKETRAQL